MPAAARPTGRSWRGVAIPAVACTALQAGLTGWLVRSGSPAALPSVVAGVVAIAALVGIAARPQLVAVVGAAAVAGLLLVPVGPPAALLALLAALVNAAARRARWWAIGTAAGALVLPGLELAVTRDPLNAVRAVGECFALGVAVAIGEALRVRRQRAVDERAAAEARVRFAAEQERVRIARELHDVLAHSLSAISVQAGVGLHLAETRPEAARDALATIRTASTAALAEVRGVIGVLRGDEDAPRAPGPDLDAVGRLVADASSLGLEVVLEDRLRPRPGAAAQLALHRVVQESLTNAARHAGGRRVEVVLERTGDAAVARIRDRDGSAPSAPDAARGRGLTGMRERAELLGGTLELVPHPDGLEVVARIPVEA